MPHNQIASLWDQISTKSHKIEAAGGQIICFLYKDGQVLTCGQPTTSISDMIDLYQKDCEASYLEKVSKVKVTSLNADELKYNQLQDIIPAVLNPNNTIPFLEKERMPWIPDKVRGNNSQSLLGTMSPSTCSMLGTISSSTR